MLGKCLPLLYVMTETHSRLQAKGRPSKRDQRVTQALSRQIAAPHIEAGGVHYVIKPSSGAKDHLAGVKASLPPGPYDFELLWRPSPPRGLTLGRQSHLSGGNNQDCTIEDVPYTCV